MIEWVEDDVLYWIQAPAGTKRQERKRLRRMANSAIRHGALTLDVRLRAPISE